MEQQNDPLGALRREAIRAVLERVQGDMLKNNEGASNKDVTPEGVTEELDVAYVNRNGIPLAMDIIGPAATEGAELPVIVTIHGGGLVTGDRRISRAFARQLALRGYLVFSIEYRLAPRANVCDQLDDVCAGMDLVGKRLVNYDVDFGRIYLTSESAGAFLAIYVAAMKDSPKLQKAIGYEPTRMRFRALGLISGMFYTNRPDPIGVLFSEQFYGEKRADEEFLRYTDPEHQEIVKHLPPCYFITSRGDFLNDYTLSYYRAVKDAGKKAHLLYFKEDNLAHAFVTLRPKLKKSQEAINKMCAWFEERSREALHAHDDESSRLAWVNTLHTRIESGELHHQKSWRFIREINSVSETRLDAPALVDNKRTYTYRQFFREQDRYAEAFCALGITQDSGSRVGIVVGGTPQNVIACYALNMVGASVSMLSEEDVLVQKCLKRAIKAEKITDLIIPDYCVDTKLLRNIVSLKKSLGLRHVIVLHASKDKSLASELSEEQTRQNYRELKKVDGALFMPKLLRTYEATPIAYARDTNDEAAVIVHTSGTTKAVKKPIPLSDYGLNAASARFFNNELFMPLVGKAVTAYTLPASTAYGMVDMVHLPLSLGCAIVFYEGTLPSIMQANQWPRIVAQKRVNVLFTITNLVNMWGSNSDTADLDLSSVTHVVCGGGSLSNDQLRRAQKVFKKCGAHATFINGYGLSECGGAAVVHVVDDKAKDGHTKIGRPLKGVRVLVQDVQTGEFRSLGDGPCTGVLYISSESNSCGRLGDQVLFEQEYIDGEPYICTNDMVQVDESGLLTFIGRGNRYFVDDKGVRFDAGVVEAAIASQPGISQCAIVPAFERVTVHDTVPVLYVSVAKGSKRRKTVRKALVNAYVHDVAIVGNSLPWRCVICDALPTNASGKVDITRVMQEKPKGKSFAITAVRRGNKLVDVRLSRVELNEQGLTFSTPEGVSPTLKRERRTMEKNFARVYGAELASRAMREALGNEPAPTEWPGQAMGIFPFAWPATKGFVGKRYGVLPSLLSSIFMQHSDQWKEGVATMGKKKKMPKMPMMPGMPMKGQMPMMPFGPQPGKKGKKGKKGKGPKGPMDGFMPMIPMMPMPPAPKPRKGKKGPKGPKGFKGGFAPMLPMIPMMPMGPMGPAPKPRKGRKPRKGPKGPKPFGMK